MNYLKNNLDNSLILPYDIMKDIYEYADPLYGVRQQIENKEYDLEEIYFLKRPTICGLNLKYPSDHRSIMINALKYVKPEVNYENRSTKRLYKLWCKL